MPTATNIYDTNVLVQVVPNLKTAQNWLLDTFFRNVVLSDSEYISIDVEIGKRRMAPFVSPLVEGKLVESRRVQTNTFKPPYIKDKRAPDLLRPVRRQIGERIGGDMTPAQRMEANLAYEMTDQIDMLNRRLEWMAAQALLNGTVQVSGDGFPTTLVDFGRDSALTFSVTGSGKWDTGGSPDPSGNLVDWAALMLKKSGAVATDIIFTQTPWKKFIADQKVRDSLWFPRSGDSRIELGGGAQRGALFKGVWGNFNLWIYNDWYVDEADNTEKPMIPDGSVIMTGPELLGTRAFASIIDPKFAYGAMAYAPKIWDQDDPAQRFLMMQSAPLVIPGRPNASLCATVTDAVVS